jgi:DNA-directed RNA polymerase subunit beta
MSLNDLKDNMKQMILENIDQNSIKNYLLNYIKIIDCTRDGWYFKQFLEQLPEVIDESFINNLFLIQPPFESLNEEKLNEALEYTNTKRDYKIFEPIHKAVIKEDVSIGYMYFFRMSHIAESKLAARGIGSYMKRTLQPLSGRKNRGAQRCGEMETAAFISHDAIINLTESLTTKSDCIDLKNNYIRNELGTDLIDDDSKFIDPVPESVKILESYLKVIGINMDIKELENQNHKKE